MLVLALDSTTRAGSVALWRDTALDVRPGDGSRTHAERLPAELADVAAAHGCSISDVDLFAVASGPGSFTGMRVGIATIQALALVQGKPVVAVSTLDLLACAGAAHAGGAALVLSWMEAYRGEVFASITRVRTGGAAEPPQLELLAAAAVGRPADLAADWAPRLAAAAGAETSTLIVIGDAVPSTTETLRSALGPGATLLDAPPLAGFLAQAAAAAPHLAVRPHAIVPVYVRRPDAELGRDRQRAQSQGRQDPTGVAPAR
jgi:tRNA threonylcarbamoyladenosine biosynthesis protein TsaB